MTEACVVVVTKMKVMDTSNVCWESLRGLTW